MIHAVAEGLCSELGRGRLPRPNAWRARVRGWICRPTLRWLVLQATVCVCVKCVGVGTFLADFSARRVGALRFRPPRFCVCVLCWSLHSVHAVRGPSHTSVRPNISSHGTAWLCEQDTIQRPARKASCSECKATSSSGSAGAQPRTAATYSASAAGGIHTQVGEASIPIFP